jgi:anhydro-N-acetylmuramic acid kinase
VNIVGLMSGTSMDGIDAALMEFGGKTPETFTWRLLAFEAFPYDDARRAQLRAAVDGGRPADLCRLHADLAEWSAEAVLGICESSGTDPQSVDAIGSHGHTVWHIPPQDGSRGYTLQLGDPSTIAERTGIPVVSDFRTADVAAGGHGAPLVPWPDRLLFSLPGKGRALQNIGGIGNVTWIPPRESNEPLLAFDTGPGNVLMDLAADAATDGAQRCDLDGALAARGRVDEVLLKRLSSHPFYDLTPPRSTGRELFGPAIVRELAEERGLVRGRAEEGWPDLLATLTRLTAWSIGDAYRRWVVPRGVEEVVVAGGGARNPSLVKAIAEEVAPLPVRGEDALGLNTDAKEAAAFAVLAWAHLMGVPANAPEATGAEGPRVLGSYTPGMRKRPHSINVSKATVVGQTLEEIASVRRQPKPRGR